MKRDSKQGIEKQIRHAAAKHQEFSELLELEERRRAPNQTEIRRLKKRKLMYKDRREALERKLEALSAPPKPLAEVIKLPTPQPELVRSPAPARRIATG